jgi:FkbM family methyltransferase
VIQQVFADQDYALDALKRGAELRAAYERIARPLIVDAGANIGASAVYFSLFYPRAHVVAVEPERGNFELLERNTRGLDVDARLAGIAAAAGTAALVDPGEGDWGYRTVAAAAGGTVNMLSMSSLVSEEQVRGGEPFIAKIDIEGAEAELFSADTAWIDAFPLLIVELHDWLIPGGGTSRNFLRCMAARDRDFVYVGENVFSIRNG